MATASPGRRAAPAARLLAAALGAALVVALASCTSSAPRQRAAERAAEAPGTLRVLAGSELKDVVPLLGQVRNATGVNLAFEYAGTLDGAERIATRRTDADLAWFSSARYLTLLASSTAGGRPIASERIMLSPVVLGLKRSVASRFGWVGNPKVTWKDIAVKAKAGQLRYGMTNPAASNSGFSALVGVAAAMSGTGNALRAEDINAAKLTDFFSGQTLTAGSSGFLADAFVADQDRVDGLVNYESVLLSLNASGRLREPLELIYPREGIITADYPLLLLNPAKRAAYDKVVAYLRSPAVQRQLMTTTNRRPAITEVAPDSRFPKRVLIELPFPASREVIDKLLVAYLDKFRRPTHAVFVLDLSSSMQGDRLASLKQALVNLTGADTSVTGRFARFRARERITIITFSTDVLDERDFTVDRPASLEAVRNYVSGLRTDASTAIFSALRRAYQRVDSDTAADAGYLTSVVLMTDGENNAGISVDDFLAGIKGGSEHVRSVKTFAIRFGEADPTQLQQVARATGGAVFDAVGGSLAAAFKEIRGYQ